MSNYIISLAGIPIGVSDLHPATKKFFLDYLSDETPLFSITIRQEDIEYEREQAVLQNVREGIHAQKYADWYLETLAIHRKIAAKMFDYDVALFHGSAIALDGKAYIFTAPSGTGKTTHTRLWLKLFPGAYVLNGDKPFLKFLNGKTLACGTPWQGKEKYGTNEILPLEAICILEQDNKNHITKIPFEQAAVTLLRQTYRPKGTDGMLKALDMCKKIGNSVNLYHLKCNTEQEAAVISSRAMLGTKYE